MNSVSPLNLNPLMSIASPQDQSMAGGLDSTSSKADKIAPTNSYKL